MARYQYTGPGPDETSGELIRPGDVREFDADPGVPWTCIDPEPEPAPPVTPFTAPATPEGM